LPKTIYMLASLSLRDGLSSRILACDRARNDAGPLRVDPIMPPSASTPVSWPSYLGRKASLSALVLLAGALTAAAQIVPSSPAAEPITPIPAPAQLEPRPLALGEQLFHDTRLSHDNTRSCASCHDTGTNGASANAQDRGAHGLLLPLNTPTVFNAALNFRLNWEGNLRSLEREAEEGLRNPAIMASSAEEVIVKINADAVMVQRFRDAYARPPDVAALLNAIATYERSLLTPGSRFDRWLAGETAAISPDELSGYLLFKSLGCISCHQGVNVGGNLFQRHGVFYTLGTPEPELVRVPSLRNVVVTAPYFHDGSAATLNEAVRKMGLAQLDRVLTDQQVGSIVAFLRTLTGVHQGRSVTPASAQPTVDAVPR
jgi:cytochrome c peroxidase